MKDKQFTEGLRFVVDVTSAHVERLPKYEILRVDGMVEDSPLVQLSAEEAPKQPKSQAKSQRPRTKRTCGQSQKSVRMSHKETPSLSHK